MKKLKFLFMFAVVFALSGCMDIAINVNVKNDDSGQLVYTVAFEEEFYKGSDMKTSLDSDVDKTMPDAKVEDITYKKDDKNYIGKKVTANFKSLAELNDYLVKISKNEETDEKDSSGSLKPIKAERKGDIVTITAPADTKAYDESKMYLEYVDYNINFKVAGRVITNNADTYEHGNLNWTIKTVLLEGINLKYDTNVTNDYVWFAVISLALVVAGTVIFFMRKNKQV